MIYSDNDLRVLSDMHLFLRLSTANNLIIFAHGDIQNKLGFDMVSTDSINTFNSIMNVRYGGDTRIPETVITPDGETCDALIIAWEVHGDSMFKVRGYLVGKHDTPSIELAEAKAKAKSRFQ